MSETKHTPGPWRISQFRATDLERLVVEASNGDGPVVVASFPDAGDYEANARLIAAAPDLYEALSGLVEATVRDANEHGISGFTGARLTDARAALAKASPSDGAQGEG